MDDCKTKIRTFLLRFFQSREIQEDEDIFSLGFVNSLMAIQLVSFLQKEFGITIEDDELEFDNFRTIARMGALVARKRARVAV